MHNFNHYYKQVCESSSRFPYELHYTVDSMRASKEFKTMSLAIQHALNTPRISEWSLFRNAPGFHSTTQEEYLINWYDKGGNYWSNRALKDPKLLAKKYVLPEPVTTSETLVTHLGDQLKEEQEYKMDSGLGGSFKVIYKGLVPDLNSPNYGKREFYQPKTNDGFGDKTYYLYDDETKKLIHYADSSIYNESGELQQVQAGEVIKLQKPAVETFANRTMNNDGVEIADCTICGANSVLVADHICKTVIDNTVPDQHDVVDETLTLTYESLRSKYGVNENKMLTKIEWFKNIVLDK